MSRIKLPNIRRIFIPDPGYLLVDADLAGADAQVVAWEADDEQLKADFRAGKNVHAGNAKAMFGELAGLDGLAEPYYSQNKGAVHATNYVGSAHALAANFGWTLVTSRDFKQRWFYLHPGIKAWHKRIDLQLRTPNTPLTRTVTNKFGYRCPFLDRMDGLLPKAVAWIAQSTVAIICFQGAVRLDAMVPEAQILLTTHDSITFQIMAHLWQGLKPQVKEALHITVPYDDPLIIPWELKTSRKSWGHLQKESW